MMQLSDLLKIIAGKTKKVIWVLGLNAFSLILVLVFIDLILGGFIFYKYVFLVEKMQPVSAGNIVKFDYKNYQNVLEHLQATGQTDVNIISNISK